MINGSRAIIIILAACLPAAAHARQQSGPDARAPKCAAHGQHASGPHDHHMAELNQRGNRAMGFDQLKTTHHFRLSEDGGAIEVEANDASDHESKARIRRHLAQVSRMFAAGDFSTPFAVHARAPHGAERMERLRAEIRYEYEETEKGGRVRISTKNAEALAAIHEFLRFQISDHRTGDPTEVIK